MIKDEKQIFEIKVKINQERFRIAFFELDIFNSK